MDVYRIVTNEKRCYDKDIEKIILAYKVSAYLLEPTETNLKECLRSMGRLLKFFSVLVYPKDLTGLKRVFSKKEVLFMLSSVILNEEGYMSTIPALLKAVLSIKK